MDPGNWATDLAGGASLGYQLLWVIAASNLMAVLLQTLAARLGIVSGRDLAQACRESYGPRINFFLWLLCELAIVACDLAEVLGAAIGLKLLFHLPLLAGVLLTSLDTVVVLWLQRFGIRIIEAVVLVLIAVIGGCFGIEILLARPQPMEILGGLVPHITGDSLYLAIAILGATVMPHNLYLHSALVQTRRIGTTEAQLRTACRFNLLDSTVALTAAMLVNMAILIMAASVFHTRGKAVQDIQDAYLLLAPLLGTTLAGILFASALICSGQSSTLTGTMAGQIVMEGFLDLRVRPWVRRIMTRMLAVLPAALTIYIAGEKQTGPLLVMSQVVLCMQLPFAVIPLIHLTSDKRRMGSFANRPWVKAFAWLSALVIVGLNGTLAAQLIQEAARGSEYGGAIRSIGVVIALGLAGLLAWLLFRPLVQEWRRASSVRLLGSATGDLSGINAPVEELIYRRILVPLDHSSLDRLAMSHAIALARSHGADLFLLHVEEGVTSQVYGALASTAEVHAGREYLDEIAASLGASKIRVEKAVRHSSNPKQEIVRYAREIEPDLLIMGAHGHGRLQDLLFGNTIDPVRHALRIPVLVVRECDSV